jgi:hypothetical protein
MFSEKADIICASLFLSPGAGFDLARVGSFCQGVTVGGVEENVGADYSVELELNPLIVSSFVFEVVKKVFISV